MNRRTIDSNGLAIGLGCAGVPGIQGRAGGARDPATIDAALDAGRATTPDGGDAA